MGLFEEGIYKDRRSCGKFMSLFPNQRVQLRAKFD